MTSTLRVIQFSTSSFCAPHRGSVGPSQISSTPSSRAASSAPARQLMKYGSPFAFGIIAITGRRPADVVGRAADDAGAAPERPSDEASERTSQTFVPATISDPARMAAQRTATWLFLTVGSPPWPAPSPARAPDR